MGPQQGAHFFIPERAVFFVYSSPTWEGPGKDIDGKADSLGKEQRYEARGPGFSGLSHKECQEQRPISRCRGQSTGALPTGFSASFRKEGYDGQLEPHL